MNNELSKELQKLDGRGQIFNEPWADTGFYTSIPYLRCVLLGMGGPSQENWHHCNVQNLFSFCTRAKDKVDQFDILGVKCIVCTMCSLCTLAKLAGS